MKIVWTSPSESASRGASSSPGRDRSISACRSRSRTSSRAITACSGERHVPSWHRFREESPEKYESYTDLVPGQWTNVRIEVKGDRARLFVNGAEEPTLIVNDLKLGAGTAGSIGVWIGPGTIAHFANVRVSSR